MIALPGGALDGFAGSCGCRDKNACDWVVRCSCGVQRPLRVYAHRIIAMRYELPGQADKLSRTPTWLRRAAVAALLMALAGWSDPRSGWCFARSFGPAGALAQTGRGARAADEDPTTPLIHLDLNLPAYRLDVFLRHERVRRYRVAIGMPDYRTPRGTFEISQIQWNPWWVPPKKAWAKNERVTPPGPMNPMGKVKLPFLPQYFIHGTPDEASLGKPSSHGCVRLSNRDAIDLSTLIQQAYLGTVTSDSVLKIALPSLRTTTAKLHEPIPVESRYDLAEVVADTLFVYPDPYRLGASPSLSAVAALVRAGLDTTALDLSSVRRLTRYPARVPVAVPVHRLLRP